MLHDSYAGPACSDPFLQLRSLPSDCPFARRRAPILRLLFPDSAAVTPVYSPRWMCSLLRTDGPAIGDDAVRWLRCGRDRPVSEGRCSLR